MRAGLARLGVRRGDRVAGYLANTPEAIAGVLATASLGAVWSSCPPEFGVSAVLDRFRRDNAQGEEYLTDAIGLLRGDGKKVVAVAAASPAEILGVNTRDQLREIEEILERRAASEGGEGE